MLISYDGTGSKRRRKAARVPTRIVGGIRVKRLPDVATILAAYDFDPLVGLLNKRRPVLKGLNKIARGSRAYARNWGGKRAGNQSAQGYRVMRIKGSFYAEHRLVWKVVHGADPVGWIDHINGMRDDNRIANLRDVTPTENAINAMRDRWAAEMRSRPITLAMNRLREKAEREDRERNRFARLKAKYEPLGAGWSAMM